MRVAVTGANSFIGRRLLAALSNRDGIQTVGIVRRNSAAAAELEAAFSCDVVECDMQDYSKLGEMTGACDCFVNLSWLATRGGSRDDYPLQEESYRYSLQAMESMASAGCSVLVSAGSQAEYGQPEGEITEDTPCEPDTAYGYYKLRLFEDTSSLCDRAGVRFVEPRFFSLYGPGDYERTLVMSCIRKMRAGEDCRLNECLQMWDYLYIDDAVEALVALCEKDSAEGAFNFCSGDNRSIRDFVEEIHSVLSSNSLLEFGAPDASYSGKVINLMPSNAKLHKCIGWTPKVPFAEGIRRTAVSL